MKKKLKLINNLREETKYGNDAFYLVEHNDFVNADTHDVSYHKDEKRLYIRDRVPEGFEGSEWRPYVKE